MAPSTTSPAGTTACHGGCRPRPPGRRVGRGARPAGPGKDEPPGGGRRRPRAPRATSSPGGGAHRRAADPGPVAARPRPPARRRRRGPSGRGHRSPGRPRPTGGRGPHHVVPGAVPGRPGPGRPRGDRPGRGRGDRAHRAAGLGPARDAARAAGTAGGGAGPLQRGAGRRPPRRGPALRAQQPRHRPRLHGTGRRRRGGPRGGHRPGPEGRRGDARGRAHPQPGLRADGGRRPALRRWPGSTRPTPASWRSARRSG